MLLYLSRWRFATERNLEREARLLCFATGTPTGGEPADETSEPNVDSPQEPERRKELNESAIRDEEKNTRKRIKGTLEIEEENTPEKMAANIQEEAITLEGKLKNLRKTLDDEGILLFLKQTGQEAKRAKIIETIETELLAAHQILAINGDIEKWTKGNLNVDVFIKDMELFYKNAKSEQADANMVKLQEYRDLHIEKFKQAQRRSDPESTYGEIERWETKSSDITPRQFVDVIRNYFNIKNADDHNVLNALEAYLNDPAHAQTINMWDAGNNASSRLTMIQELSDIAQIGVIKKEIEEFRKLRKDMEEMSNLNEVLIVLKQNISNQGTDMQKVENVIREKSDLFKKDYDLTATHGSYNVLGMEFYSAREVWAAMEEVYEAFHTAWHDHSHHKTAELAKNIGGSLEWIPMYGTPANIALKKSQESHNEKEKNEYIEYLKQNSFSFDQLFTGHNSQLHLNHHNVNRVRAILEFAAGKGWLYDLDLSAGQNAKKVFGRDLAHLLHDLDEHELLNYFNSLRGTNASGRESEIKAAHDKVKDIENIPFFISEIEAEMKGSNLWAAVGIAQRAIERGLWGETIPWVMTTVMRVLRDNKEVRKKASVDFFDKLGALSLYHSDSSMGGLKLARKDLYKWGQYGDDSNLETITVSMRVMKDIEADIRQRTGQSFDEEGKGENSKYKLDSYVAKIFASQPVTINGKKFSIFSHKYDYFTHNKLHQGDVKISSEDEDYYRETTGNLRADAIVMKEIFRLSSTGQLQNESRATAYAGNILGLAKKLEMEGMQTEADNFRKITGGKLQSWLESEILRNGRSMPILQFHTDNGFFIQKLFIDGFIPISVLETAIEENWDNAKLAKEVLRKVRPGHPLAGEVSPAKKAGAKGETGEKATPLTQAQKDEQDFKDGKTMWPGGIENLPKTTQAP